MEAEWVDDDGQKPETQLTVLKLMATHTEVRDSDSLGLNNTDRHHLSLDVYSRGDGRGN